MSKDERIFSEEDIKVIGQFFEVIFQAARRQGMFSPPIEDSAKEDHLMQDRMIPLPKWKDYHDWPTESSFRWMIFNSHKSGADYFIRKAGRRVLIHEKKFFEWANMNQDERVKVSADATKWKEQYGRKK